MIFKLKEVLIRGLSVWAEGLDSVDLQTWYAWGVNRSRSRVGLEIRDNGPGQIIGAGRCLATENFLSQVEDESKCQ